MWLEEEVIEELFIDVIGRFKGQMQEEAVQAAEIIGLVQHRIDQLKKTQNKLNLSTFIEKLGLLGSQHSVAALEVFISHPNSNIRFLAIRSLARLGHAASLEKIIHSISNEKEIDLGRFADNFMNIIWGLTCLP